MKFQRITLEKVFPYLLIVTGILGLITAFILTQDILAMIQNSKFVPTCNLNPVLSCGNVINAPGDKLLGLPYPLYGLPLFPVLIGAGVGMLAGAIYKRWYWITFQVLVTLGTIGAYYLLLKSVYQIHSLCPFCLSVDVVTTVLFWYTTLYNLDTKMISPRSAKAKVAYKWIRKHHLDLLVLWFLIVTGLLLKHFWYYYGKHL